MTIIPKAMKSLLIVLRAAGTDRVLRAMTRVCTPGYENHGWNNCFFTQMFGNRAAIQALQAKHSETAFGGLADEDKAVAKELGIPVRHVNNVISLFDNEWTEYGKAPETVNKMLSYTRKWLRDRLRRAGKPNPLLRTATI